MKENIPRPMLSIGRYTAMGALVGLLVGAIEGMCAFRYPNPHVLLQPDVSYVILFLGPLRGALVGGFLGLVSGLLVGSRSNRIWRGVAPLLEVCMVALLVLAIAKDLRYALLGLMGAYPTPLNLAMSVGILVVGPGAFIMGRLLPLRTLSGLLAGAFVILLLAVGVSAISPQCIGADVAANPPGPAGEPNIILITLDTVRADHLSLYGYPRRTTPEHRQVGASRRGVRERHLRLHPGRWPPMLRYSPVCSLISMALIPPHRWTRDGGRSRMC